MSSVVSSPDIHACIIPTGTAKCKVDMASDKPNSEQVNDSPRPPPRIKKIQNLARRSMISSSGDIDTGIVSQNCTSTHKQPTVNAANIRHTTFINPICIEIANDHSPLVSTNNNQVLNKPVAKPRKNIQLKSDLEPKSDCDAVECHVTNHLASDQKDVTDPERQSKCDTSESLDVCDGADECNPEVDPLKRMTLYGDLLNIINPGTETFVSEKNSTEDKRSSHSPWPDESVVNSTIQRMSETGVLKFPDHFFTFESDFLDGRDPFENTNFESVCQSFNTAIDDTQLSPEQETRPHCDRVAEDSLQDESRDRDSKSGTLIRKNGLVKRVSNIDGQLGSSNLLQKSGYLLKQGGHNSNRGWNKRWVVFNGTSLRYYKDSSSSQSIRIVPLKCMLKVEVDIKPTDRDSFKFTLHTNIKNRVFLFASETRDNCIQWALTLGAAITQCQKYGWFQESLEKPDKEGFVRINSKKYYSTVMDLKLTYYNTFEDFELGSPIHEIELKLASLKIVDEKRFKLKLSTHSQTFFDLTFQDQDDMQQWKSALEEAIVNSLGNDEVLKQVQENESNLHCADCSSERAYWASVNLGVVLCDNCAGVHRTFNLKQSKVRSLRMDVNVWTPSLIDLMIHVGNSNANVFWECKLPLDSKIQSACTIEERKAFLTDKYISKKYCETETPDKLSAVDLVSISNSNDVIEVMKILFGRENAPEKISAAYEAAKENGRVLVAEFLFQNGGDRQQMDNSYNERLEEIKLTGFLSKPGPKHGFEKKRWCVLSHGALMYYANEKGSKCKGLIQRNDILMVRVNDANSHQFEISTKIQDNRIFTFSSDKEDIFKWVEILTKTLIAATLWEQINMKDVRCSGLGMTRENALSEDWAECLFVLSQSSLHFVRANHDMDSVPLCGVTGVTMNDEQQIEIRSQEKSMRIKAILGRDTEKFWNSLKRIVPNACI